MKVAFGLPASLGDPLTATIPSDMARPSTSQRSGLTVAPAHDAATKIERDVLALPNVADGVVQTEPA